MTQADRSYGYFDEALETRSREARKDEQDKQVVEIGSSD